jgi:hypothetical protein
MEAEELVLHNRRERQEVKQISEALPHIGITILSGALVVEAVDLSDLPGFVVASEQSNPISEAHLEGKE